MNADFDNYGGARADEIELLHEILTDLRQLTAWVRQDSRDLDDMELRAEHDLEAGAVSPLAYAIDIEEIRRGREVAICCLRDYERQHKIVVRRLIELQATTK